MRFKRKLLINDFSDYHTSTPAQFQPSSSPKTPQRQAQAGLDQVF